MLCLHVCQGGLTWLATEQNRGTSPGKHPGGRGGGGGFLRQGADPRTDSSVERLGGVGKEGRPRSQLQILHYFNYMVLALGFRVSDTSSTGYWDLLA